MDERKDTAVEAVLEHLIEHGPGDIATVFARAFELAMQIERERFLGAGLYERTAERRGYANGYKPKRIDTPAGTVAVDVPKTAGHDTPFYPQSLERSHWSAAVARSARSSGKRPTGAFSGLPHCWRWRRCTSRGEEDRKTVRGTVFPTNPHGRPRW